MRSRLSTRKSGADRLATRDWLEFNVAAGYPTAIIPIDGFTAVNGQAGPNHEANFLVRRANPIETEEVYCQHPAEEARLGYGQPYVSALQTAQRGWPDATLYP